MGTAIGSVISAVVTKKGVPEYGFGFAAIFQIFVLIAGMLLSDEVETNEFATVKDELLLEYEHQQLLMNPELEQVPEPGLYSRVCMKMRAICRAVHSPLILTFYAYLILSGFCTPSFGDFDYYFAIDKLGITNDTIGLQ